MARRLRDDRPLAERFWDYVDKGEGADACWEWAKAIMRTGYGCVRSKNVTLACHRVAWELTNGVITDPDVCVLHRCDNRKCVRPDHLFIGTRADNVRDMHEKGRGAGQFARGDAHPRSKVTTGQVLQIRARREAGETMPAIAKDYGISPENVSGITNGHHWTHV